MCSIWSVLLAALLAQEAGLPLGNYWEPGIARTIASIEKSRGRQAAEREIRFRLGLKRN